MFQFNLEQDLALLTVTRVGIWSLETVSSYESALRPELVKLKNLGGRSGVIIDIRLSDSQPIEVVEALRAMVCRIVSLLPARMAIVTSSGLAKLEAKRATDPDARVFTSMVLARDWIRSDLTQPVSTLAGSEPSEASAEGPFVHVTGPFDVDIIFTAEAALETAKRIADAAVEVLIGHPTSESRVLGLNRARSAGGLGGDAPKAPAANRHTHQGHRRLRDDERGRRPEYRKYGEIYKTQTLAINSYPPPT